MEGICTVNKSKDDDLEWVIFNEKFNNCLTIEILQFLSQYKAIIFGERFNKPIDFQELVYVIIYID